MINIFILILLIAILVGICALLENKHNYDKKIEDLNFDIKNIFGNSIYDKDCLDLKSEDEIRYILDKVFNYIGFYKYNKDNERKSYTYGDVEYMATTFESTEQFDEIGRWSIDGDWFLTENGIMYHKSDIVKYKRLI